MSDYIAGKGLPTLERVFIKYSIIPIMRIFNRGNFSYNLLCKEEKKIKNLIENKTESELKKRIKIDRIFGIENHSRDYSINMCLEHLRITGTAITRVIKTLSLENDFKNPILIESVKPKENSDKEIEKFFIFMDNCKKYIKNHNKIKSSKKVKHPWFCEFNNLDWIFFIYVHTFVHRRQIETIIKNLK